MELSQESAPASPAPERPLRDEIAEVVYGTSQWSVEHPWGQGDASPVLDDAFDTADRIMQLLNERGHYLPGAPPAAQILADAKSFAERLTLSNLALRIYAMLSTASIINPETKAANNWINDYLDGRGHGPVGQAMLWPARLPGMVRMLRDWGFEATPTSPPYVARSMPNQTMQ